MFSEEYFYEDSHLIGDSAYTLQNHVLTPYKDNGFLTDEQKHFNTVHAKLRSMVERSIGLLKNRWRWLLDRIPMKRMDLVPFYIYACFIFHNICLKPDEELILPVVIDPVQGEFRGPLNPNYRQKQQGVAKRDRIAQILYN